MRIKIIRIALIVLFITIALDLVYIQVIRGGYFFNLSKNNRIRIVPLEGWRGQIKDRQGAILADSRVAYNVMISSQEIHDREALFKFLSNVLEVDQKRIEKRYAQKRLAPFAPVVVAEDIGRNKAIRLEENKYRYPSLIVQEGFKRSYPLGENSAHVLGYVGKITRARKERFKEYGYSPQSIIGYSGVEEFYDTDLKGREGGLQIEVNSRGQQVRLLSLKEPTKGQDITLTVDSRVQQIAVESMGGAVGTIIVMDMDTGEILSMVSSPGYDPNVFVDARKKKNLTKLFNKSSAPFLNRAVKGLFPPGSVFKIPVAISALDSRKITPHTTYVCNGHYNLGGQKFRCTHNHGSENLIESIAHSCNIYYYHLGRLLGPELINRYARQLGLGRPTHVDLPYEESGFIPTVRKKSPRGSGRWYAGDTLNFSIGQGNMLTTPLQLVRVIATVANDGVEVQPHLIKSIGGIPVEKYNFKRRIDIDKNVLTIVKKGMRAAVTDYSGTASILNLDQLYVAGKTGTAQSSGEKESHAWFVGYVQNDKKNLAFCVFLEHGGSSQNACLVARNLLLEMKNAKLL